MVKEIERTAQLVFPHQLFQNYQYLEKEHPVFLIEEFLFFKQYPFHKQKIAFHRATMKAYENYLIEADYTVTYIESYQEESDIQKLLIDLASKGFNNIRTTDPCDYWLEKRIMSSSLAVEILDSPLFLNNKAELKTYFENAKSFHQTDFYRQQRIYRNILMEDGKPLGGKWTYDVDNRKKYPKNKKAPATHFPLTNEYYKEAIAYTEKYFLDNIGHLTSYQLYPNNFEESQQWLKQFFELRFAEFGDFEDSIVEQENILHHSVLSPLLNIGLLTPHEVVKQAIDYAKQNKIAINSLEGFIRQIVGWREFVRGIYIYSGVAQRTTNYWKHKYKLSEKFYSALTTIKPIDSTIQKILQTGYAHHIERLMILANFMNLCQIHPNEIYRWFMIMFIDAYDWVMVPNVYGMSTFSDGGKMSTKPYSSGSNYIKKMSDYTAGTWTENWDALFWNFIFQNRSYFENNPRLNMMVRTWNKMDSEKRNQHLKVAQQTIEKLTR